MNCKCTFAQSIVGDGCDICNPELAKELKDKKMTEKEFHDLVDSWFQSESTYSIWTYIGLSYEEYESYVFDRNFDEEEE